MRASGAVASCGDRERERRRLLFCRLSVIPLANIETLEASTDAELVRRAAVRDDGGRAVEAELCRRFAPRVRLYGLRHLRDEDRARDLVQAVLLALVEAVRGARIEETAHVDHFVLGTCRNVVARMRDSEFRAISVDPVELEIAGAMPTLDGLDAPALYRCMVKLDLRSRVVVQMCFHDDATADQIGAHLGTTAGNVRVLRHRAIAQLRRCLDRGQQAEA
jgi:RNA polymerase sigma-70 factor (ECF subfamily)